MIDSILINVFVENLYFPYVTSVLAKSTVDGYRKLWRAYNQYFENSRLNLRCADCQTILCKIVADNPHLTKTTVRHIRNFFSGVCAHAMRSGYLYGGNPWRECRLPLAQDARETHAYSPEEVTLMLTHLSVPYDLIVLTAAYTGLRKSELRGLKWSDWDPQTSTLSVRRAIWRSHVKTTKSSASKAPVPVAGSLATRLEQYRQGLPTKLRAPDAWIFSSSDTGLSLDLGNVARRIIVPTLAKTEVEWHGWHAFRRGLATFLHARGVDDKTIQAILRHENVSTTQKSYIKTIPESVRNAMAVVNFGSNRR